MLNLSLLLIDLTEHLQTPQKILCHLPLLTTKEQARIRSLKQPADKVRSLAGQLLAKQEAQTFFQVPFVELDRNPYGKPFVKQASSPREKTFLFNISHHDHYLIMATLTNSHWEREEAAAAIGVDLANFKEFDQHPEPQLSLQALLLHFTPLEKAAVLSLPGWKEKVKKAFTIWTQKEALVKAIGTGLSISLTRIECSDEEIKLDGISLRKEGWSFKTWELGDDYLIALAVKISPVVKAEEEVMTGLKKEIKVSFLDVT